MRLLPIRNYYPNPFALNVARIASEVEMNDQPRKYIIPIPTFPLKGKETSNNF